jgi:hypothetical protein
LLTAVASLPASVVGEFYALPEALYAGGYAQHKTEGCYRGIRYSFNPILCADVHAQCRQRERCEADCHQSPGY